MMNRIVWHHTAGAYVPNGTDRQAYHRLVDGDGRVHDGDHGIESNAPGRIRPGHYAAHTRNLNSGSIGLSICAMASGVWADPFGGRFPVKPVQVDALVAETARLCRKYSIQVNQRQVLSHAEVEPTLGVKQRNKWDFDYHPRGLSGRDPVAIGRELREEVLRALGGLSVAPAVFSRATVRQGSRGADVTDLQKRLSLTADGVFGPKTRTSVVTFQKRNNLLPDGIVGAMTWAALFPNP